uniref:Uncharacterized protein n=1 Tax=Angiostrongylus cantonensis TaxID=6313 RepID=A0A0K0D9F7_ANGCA
MDFANLSSMVLSVVLPIFNGIYSSIHGPKEKCKSGQISLF